MALLDAVTSVADEAGYQVDRAKAIGATDAVSVQLRTLANRIIAEMAERYDWPKLWRSASITLVDGQATYALPGDFSYYHYDTFWNKADGFQAWGPYSPQDYAELIGSTYDLQTTTAYTLRGAGDNFLTIYPTPGSGVAGQIIIFEYASNRYVRPQSWAQGLSVAIGDYVSRNGNYYRATTAGTTGATPPTHATGSASDGVVTWAFYDGAYSKFLADTDEPVLPQRVLEQGMLERFAVLKGVSVSPMYEQTLLEEYRKQRPGRSFSVVGPRDGESPRRLNFGALS